MKAQKTRLNRLAAVTKEAVTKLVVGGAWHMIAWYQVTLSLDHGPLKHLFPGGVCRYTPTCSQYAQQCLRLYGWRGFVFAARRLLRCHPLARAGYDPVKPPPNSEC